MTFFELFVAKRKINHLPKNIMIVFTIPEVKVLLEFCQKKNETKTYPDTIYTSKNKKIYIIKMF